MTRDKWQISLFFLFLCWQYFWGHSYYVLLNVDLMKCQFLFTLFVVCFCCCLTLFPKNTWKKYKFAVSLFRICRFLNTMTNREKILNSWILLSFLICCVRINRALLYSLLTNSDPQMFNFKKIYQLILPLSLLSRP